MSHLFSAYADSICGNRDRAAHKSITCSNPSASPPTSTIMAEYPQYTPDVAHDFELYSHNSDQHLDFQHNQSFAPSSTYAMDPAFSAQYDPMAPLSHVSRHSDLQFHYDGIAQGVKPFHYQTPAGSPHSTSHSFHEIPPVLSASSESGASVSSSAMGSPSILPPFNDSWNSFSMATTSGYDYPGMVAHEKSYVGKSIVSSIPLSILSFYHKSHLAHHLNPCFWLDLRDPRSSQAVNSSSVTSSLQLTQSFFLLNFRGHSIRLT